MANGKSEEAVEKALAGMLQSKGDKSYTPPEQRSIRELIEDLEEAMAQVESRVRIIKGRLDEFYRLQNQFYTGDR